MSDRPSIREIVWREFNPASNYGLTYDSVREGIRTATERSKPARPTSRPRSSSYVVAKLREVTRERDEAVAELRDYKAYNTNCTALLDAKALECDKATYLLRDLWRCCSTKDLHPDVARFLARLPKG